MYNQKKAEIIDGGFAFDGKPWLFDNSFSLQFLLEDGTALLFNEAKSITQSSFTSGLGSGVRTLYKGFDKYPDLSFETQAMVDSTTGHAHLTFVPLATDSLPIKEVFFPQPLICQGENSYAVVNTLQGQLIPSDWPEAMFEKKGLPFNGQMCSCGAYLPWFGEIAKNGGYLCYNRQPWDSAYTIEHPAGGPNRVYYHLLPSLGAMRYARTVTYVFVPRGSDYVSLCQAYRAIADEEGRTLTLKQKAALNPNVAKLVGCCVMHCPGKTHVVEDSFYYNREEPEKNDSLHTFDHWTQRVKRLKDMGVSQLYLHLDGWGEPGYDNKHPDYLPACEAMGGWEGMRRLSDTMRDLGYMFGIHDQYRDYYLDAPTYDIDNAAMSADGSVFKQARWAGGWQNFLCASLAPSYVRRNFEELFRQGIHLEGTYLDVFTCNEPDECVNPRHPMTREDCLRYRGECLHYLTAHNIVPSSEEVNDWAIPYQVFCHWAPYYGETAIPVPLFNLVWHDCVMIPWMMEADSWGMPKGTNGFLQALLNGGMGYMSESKEGEELQENIRQWKVISDLHHKVAYEKMVKHEFLNESRTRQRTTFSNGITVEVDFEHNTYTIKE